MKFSAIREKKQIFFIFILILALAVLVSKALTKKSDIEPELIMKAPPEGREGAGGDREDWFYTQRAYPLETIPLGARSRSIEQLERVETLRRIERSRAGNESALEPEQQLAWAAIGPAPIDNGFGFGGLEVPVSGRVSAVALDPGYNGTTNQTVYIGTAQGGVWRSRDNGVNWTPLIDDQPSLAVGALAIDPTNPNIIYVGTGEGAVSGNSYYGAGLLKSVDGGTTWTQITGPVSTTDPQLPSFLNASFFRIAINPRNPSTVFVCTSVGRTSGASGGSGTEPPGAREVLLGNRGLWKSTDGGATWRNVNPSNSATDRSSSDIIIDPQNSDRVFAAIFNLGIYRSTQGGEPGTWVRLGGGLPDSGISRITMAVGPAVAPSAEPTIYAAFAAGNGNSLFGVFRSTDSGANWTRLTTPDTFGQSNYNLALAVDPIDANVVYIGTAANNAYNDGTVQRSIDGGNTWSGISRGNGTGGLHPDTHAIAISPTNRNLLFTGNDGGIWRTEQATSATVPWINLNRTLNITQFQSIALHPTNPNILIGGTQDNGTNRYNGSVNWFGSDGGDGGFALIDQSNPLVMYHTYFNQNNQNGQSPQLGPVLSIDGGDTWRFTRGCFRCSGQPGQINPSDRVGFYAPLAQHHGFNGPDGNVIYFGTHRLYRSANQGRMWTGLGASTDGFGADLTKTLSGFNSRLSTIAAHPRLDSSATPPGEIVWVGTNDGTVQVTTNAGAGSNAAFTNVTKAPLPNRFVTDIAPDPNDTQRAVVTYSGFNLSTPSTPGHVFLTTNSGATWSDISGDLPDVPVTSVAINPGSPNTIYIGTDIGVCQTTNGGVNWVRLGNGMPRVATFMVRYHAAGNSLIAATHGRGIFRLTTARDLSTVSAANFSASSVATEAIVAAFGTGLATGTQSASSLPLPTFMAGTKVSVRDSIRGERLAPLFFVSPQQINFQIPPGTAAGNTTISITSGDGTVSNGSSQIATVAPSLFTANTNGKGAPAGLAIRFDANNAQTNLPITRLDTGQNTFVPVPIDLGVATDQTFLIIFGTGIRFRSSLSSVTATIGGVAAPVQFAGPQGGFVGLDQCNILIPQSLVGRGNVNVMLTVEGKTANLLQVNIK